MKVFVAVASLLAVSFAKPSVQKDIGFNYIVGGVDAKQGELPYQISLRYNGQHVCGGSLAVVNGQQIVITAAHCVTNPRPQAYTVIAGDLKMFDNSNLEQTRQVTRIISHENFTLANDIAVLLIAKPFDINNNVAPIALPRRGQNTTGEIVVSGWGRTSHGGPAADNLQKVQIPVVQDAVCQQAYSRLNITLSPSMLCAGLLGVGGKSTCNGDSGGPLRAVDGNYLAGIVSFGYRYNCADARFPGVNTEVSYFIDWLENVVPLQQ